MRTIKNIIAITLVGMVLFGTFGPLLVFKMKQTQVRYEIKQRIKAGVPEKDLHLITIPFELESGENNLFKRVEDHEFRYKGEMYDIVRYEIHGNETWYYCIADEEEELLFAQLDEMVEKEINDKEGKQKQRTSSSPTITMFFAPPSKFQLPVILKETIDFNYFFSLETWLNSPPTEPPKV